MKQQRSRRNDQVSPKRPLSQQNNAALEALKECEAHISAVKSAKNAADELQRQVAEEGISPIDDQDCTC